MYPSDTVPPVHDTIPVPQDTVPRSNGIGHIVPSPPTTSPQSSPPVSPTLTTKSVVDHAPIVPPTSDGFLPGKVPSNEEEEEGLSTPTLSEATNEDIVENNKIPLSNLLTSTQVAEEPHPLILPPLTPVHGKGTRITDDEDGSVASMPIPGTRPHLQDEAEQENGEDLSVTVTEMSEEDEIREELEESDGQREYDELTELSDDTLFEETPQELYHPRPSVILRDSLDDDADSDDNSLGDSLDLLTDEETPEQQRQPPPPTSQPLPQPLSLNKLQGPTPKPSSPGTDTPTPVRPSTDNVAATDGNKDEYEVRMLKSAI